MNRNQNKQKQNDRRQFRIYKCNAQNSTISHHKIYSVNSYFVNMPVKRIFS